METSMLALLLSLTLASASEPAPAAPPPAPELVEDSQLVEILRESNQRWPDLVLATAGPEARARLARLRREQASLPGQQVAVPTAGDMGREMRQVLEYHRSSCAIRAEIRGPRWSITRWGACAAAGAGKVATPAATGSAPAPTAAGPVLDWSVLVESVAQAPASARRAPLDGALATHAADPDAVARLANAVAVLLQLESGLRTDPSLLRLFLRAAVAADPAIRSAALAAAVQGGDPPLVAVAPVADQKSVIPAVEPVVSTATPQALRAYKSRRLYRDTLNFISVGFVNTGSSSTAYATSGATWTVYAGGGEPLNAPGFARRVGDSGKAAEMRRRKTTALLGGTALLGIGSVLALAPIINNGVESPPFGTMMLGTGMVIGGGFWPALVIQKQTTVSGSYTTSRADQLIESYNARLRTELKLTEEDVKEIDLGR